MIFWEYLGDTISTVTSVSSVKELSFTIYPNPFSSETVLQTDNFFKDAFYL
jgi:hypothetical protein